MIKRIFSLLFLSLISFNVLAVNLGPASSQGNGSSTVGDNSVQRFPRWMWIQVDGYNVDPRFKYHIKFDGHWVIDEQKILGNNYFNFLDEFATLNVNSPSHIYITNNMGVPVCTLSYYYQAVNPGPNPYPSNGDIHYSLTNMSNDATCSIAENAYYEPQTDSHDITYYLAIRLINKK